MFRRKSDQHIEVTKLSSLIAPGVEIVGDVIITDGLRVDGQVQGNVLCRKEAQGLLVLSEKGSITGGIKVYDAVINGTIRGDVEVEHFLELQSNARIIGNIRYHQLRMDCGAAVDGTLESLSERTAERPGSVNNVVPLQASSG